MLSTVPNQALINPYPTGFKSQALYYPTGYANGAYLTLPGLRRRKRREVLFPWDVQGKTKIDYLVAMFHGRRGRGKSTGATAFAKYLLQENQHLGRQYKVFANYKVVFADMCHPRLIDWLITFPKELRRCLIIVDEIAVYFPSVRATSTAALNFYTFLQEIRKLEVELIFTTQFPTMIIGAANIQVDLFVEPSLYNQVYHRGVKQWVANSVRLDCVDWWGQWTGFPVDHRWPPRPWDVVCRPSLHNLQSMYAQFNTNEIIPAFWSPNREDVLGREWESDIAQEEAAAQSQLDELRRAAAPKERAGVSSLVELLRQVDQDVINLAELLPDAKKLDPGIKKYSDLAEAMRRHGWACYQESGKYGPWIGERLKDE